ncbi:putative Transcriptional regulator, AraC family [Leptospira ryugenii]|uniref:Putative Transcriptional regulator, AraC family n=1 Tax=Leptospira ryugenii TaxID=1917863 RepID=A0A2P2DY13_9LEPT|nr:helix-turn-helix transcriptional regulator [Leptospira ryugenii]GBF49480.1 putative Transcriptional regulator, AraC family [Leptospira ryugenii]
MQDLLFMKQKDSMISNGPMNEKYIYLGKQELLYMGKILSLSVHSHITWTLCLPLQGEIRYQSKDETYKTKKAFLIPPKVDHQIEGYGSYLAFVFFEKYSPYAPVISEGSKIINLDERELLPLKEALTELMQQKDKAKHNLTFILDNLHIPIQRKSILDDRILLVQKLLVQKDLETQISLVELASSVGLSESRLSHLFKEQMGIPISSYRVWIRIRNLADALKKNPKLTFAAHSSGFFDSSHLHRVFKQYFGINPKNVFLNSLVHWI